MVIRFLSDLFGENTYIIKKGLDVFVIDPGKGTFERIKKHGGKNFWILLTHSHVDHIFELSYFAKANLFFNESVDFVNNPRSNLSLYYPMKPLELDSFNILNEKNLPDGFEVIKTPGHTPGSVCFLYMKKCLFTGDTLFSDSIGRTDLPGGSEEKLLESLKLLKGLLEKNPELEVFPGHGSPAKAVNILRQNPYLKGL